MADNKKACRLFRQQGLHLQEIPSIF